MMVAIVILLQRLNCDLWDECAMDLPQICKAMKQFLPHLEAVGAKEGSSIKTFLDRHEQTNIFIEHFLII